MDHALGVAGLRPWRCIKCKLRFYGKAVALRFMFIAHCAQCGNFNLTRISRERMGPWKARLLRLARVPAYRCGICRKRFVSALPIRHLRPVEYEMESAKSD